MDRGALRQNRRGERGSLEGKMELFRLFWFQRLQFFLLAKLARHFTERSFGAKRSSGSLRICVESCGRILRSGGLAIIFLRAFVFLCFDLRAVYRSQNVGMLEIFFGVNVLGGFLLFFFSSAFLAGGFSDGIALLVLRARNGGAESGETQKQDSRSGKPDGTREFPCACAARLERQWAV